MELAREIGVSLLTLGRIKKGSMNKIEGETAVKLVAYFGSAVYNEIYVKKAGRKKKSS